MCDARPFGQPTGLICMREHDDSGHVFLGSTLDDAHAASEPSNDDQ